MKEHLRPRLGHLVFAAMVIGIAACSPVDATGPLDGVVITDEVARELQAVVDLANKPVSVESCMAGAGFTADDRRWADAPTDATVDDFTEMYGFGMSTLADVGRAETFGYQSVDRADLTAQDAFDAIYVACVARAESPPIAVSEQAATVLGFVDREARKQVSMGTHEEEWAVCMAAAGFDLTDHTAMFDMLGTEMDSLYGPMNDRTNELLGEGLEKDAAMLTFADVLSEAELQRLDALRATELELAAADASCGGDNEDALTEERINLLKTVLADR